MTNLEYGLFREHAIDSLQSSILLHQALLENQLDPILQAGKLILDSLRQGGKILFFGNGGSAADSQHLAAELVGRFVRERDPLPAMALTTDTSALTAIGNDYGFDQVFSRQIRALGRKGDVAIGISASGRSPNVVRGMEAAKNLGLVCIALTGGDGGPLAAVAHASIVVPSTTTARIQECHIAIGHIWCEMVDLAGIGSDSSQCVLLEQKIVTIDQAIAWREQQTHQTVVWTNGCFDLLHVGHLHSLNAARQFGDRLIVGVNSDSSVRAVKGLNRPLIGETDRAAMLAALSIVDCVVIFDDLTPENVLRRLRPDVHCKGADYAPPNGKPIPEASIVTAYGGRIEFIPMLPGISTTEIIDRIRAID